MLVDLGKPLSHLIGNQAEQVDNHHVARAARQVAPGPVGTNGPLQTFAAAESEARGKSLPERLASLLCSAGVAASLWLCAAPALELLADGGPTRFVAATLQPKAAPAVQSGSADVLQVARPTAPLL